MAVGAGEEGGDGAVFDDAALVENQHAVHAAQGGEAVGDDEGGAAATEGVEVGLEAGLGLDVERAGGFVEDDDGGVAEEHAGKGEALALATGEASAAFTAGG